MRGERYNRQQQSVKCFFLLLFHTAVSLIENKTKKMTFKFLFLDWHGIHCQLSAELCISASFSLDIPVYPWQNST